MFNNLLANSIRTADDDNILILIVSVSITDRDFIKILVGRAPFTPNFPLKNLPRSV